MNLNEQTNSIGRFCIHECCIKGNIEMLKRALVHIKDINKLDNNGQTAAHICAKYNEIECLKLLCANGINLNQRDNDGLHPIHIAAIFDNWLIIEFFFNFGISLNLRCDKNGKLPFHYAAEFGSLESLKVLCTHTTDISDIDSHDGNTAAHLTVIRDNLKCLKYLLTIGVGHLNRNKSGRNIAHICCLYGSINCLHWILDNFLPEINSVDSNNFVNSFVN
jgi:ankyrin repeat protein